MNFDMPTCGACRTCEISCSFHHTGEFIPSLSSIKIHGKDSGEGYLLELLEEDGDAGKACDGCGDLNEPLCMEVCKEKELLAFMINQLIRTKNRMAV